MTEYKLVALDMDGTVLDEEQNISAANRHAIQAALDAGVIVMFATGRGRQSAMPYIMELGLESPLVAVNGSEVWKHPEQLLTRTGLQHEDVVLLRELALKHHVWYWAYSIEGVVNEDNWDQQSERGKEWLKFGFYTEDERILAEIRAVVAAEDRYEVSNSHPCNIELNPKGISKATGLEQLCAHFGFEMEQVVAVGDSLNDLEMIRASGLGVAMGNAQEAVKQEADWVTKSNEEDGVAEVIWRKVLNRS